RATRYTGLPLQGMFAGNELAYQGYGSSITSTIDIAPNMAVADFGTKAGYLLTAEFDPKAPGTGGLKLYVTAPDGTQRRLVFTTTDSIRTARFSADDRYVIITTVQHTEGGNGKMAAVLLDLEQETEPRTLVETAVRVTRTGTSLILTGSSELGTYFLRRGHFANYVLVTITDSNSGSEVKLFNPAHPEWSRTIAQVPTATVYMPTYEQPDGNTLITYASPREGMNTLVAGRPITGTLSIAQYDVALAQWTYVPVRVTTHEGVVLSPERKSEYGSDFTSFMLVGDRLAYGAFFFNPIEYSTIFYSMPLADLDKEQPAITELFKVAQSPETRFTYQSWFPGPSLFVYTDEQHALHVRTYDGAIDLVLERGVEFVRSNWFYGY
ncbi:MAG: hypothetical protein M3328_09195, partial [Chloroflexota bacterium]|nr:hypothetical protein [Chloroflexota bacterium]